MIKEIYGKKIGMTQIFDEGGNLLPTTLLEVEPVYILEKIEYPAKTRLKIGCFKVEGKKADKIKKPIKGYFEKLGFEAYKLIREVEAQKGADLSFLEKKELAPADAPKEKLAPVDAPKEELAPADAPKQDNSEEKKEEPGDFRQVGVEIFKEGELIDIRAKSKGKGFAGGMKRYHWAGQPASHGSTSHRRIGSAGASAYPSKIIKGLHMPGHMGDVFRTVKNLKVLKVDKEKNVLFIEGNVPGARGAVVRLRKVN